jgi:hypothetical protein
MPTYASTKPNNWFEFVYSYYCYYYYQKYFSFAYDLISGIIYMVQNPFCKAKNLTAIISMI